LSSINNAENKKFGEFQSNGVHLKYDESRYKDLLPSFWQWFSTGFSKLKRLHILGGEPFYQKEFDTLLDYIEKNPNPNCELNVVSNLMCSEEKLDYFIQRFKSLIVNKKIKRIDITCSIDCWGKEQEFVRWGINLEHWEKNFIKLINNKWLYVSINQTITILTIKTMPEFLEKLAAWNKIRTIRQELGTPTPGPSYLKANILGGDYWKNDFDKILKLMPETTDQEKITKKYMEGIAQYIVTSKRDDVEILKLITFLNEKDRRRGTNWRETFPWLKDFDVV
jgi:organic radical activating enzyme